jgi:hypothetical protein
MENRMQVVETLRKILREESVREQIMLFAMRIYVAELAKALGERSEEKAAEANRKPDGWNDECLRILGPLVVRLPKPPIIAAQDLARPLFDSFRECKDKADYDQSVERFLAQVGVIRVDLHRSHPLSVGTGRFAVIDDDDFVYGIDSIPLFKSESGFAIYLLGALPAASRFGGESGWLDQEAYIQLEATCTEAALQQAGEEAKQVVATLIYSGDVLFRQKKSHEAVSTLLAGKVKEALEEGLQTVAVLTKDGELGDWFSFIPYCLEAFYAQPPKKDSINRRITTATRLLTQADMQADNSVGLALSVAAVEAMLCRKGSDLANMFSENASALLEPEPGSRSQAVEWCKKLYNLRSEVLHGTGFNATSTDVSHARLLAAAVLKAMVERRNFVRRMEGDVEKVDVLLKELFADKYTPGQLTGVEESPIVYAWR